MFLICMTVGSSSHSQLELDRREAEQPSILSNVADDADNALAEDEYIMDVNHLFQGYAADEHHDAFCTRADCHHITAEENV